MPYNLMSANELKDELLRRASKMEEWTNDVNLDKALTDLSKALDEGKEANKIAFKKIEKAKKQSKLYITIYIVSVVLILGVVLTLGAVSKFLSIENPTGPIFFGSFGAFIALLISAIFAEFKFKKIEKTDYLKAANKSREKFEVLYWYYLLMCETDSKLLYKKVYEDTYKVCKELSKDPEIKKRIEATKKDLGIDFSYVNEKLKAAEERVRKEGIDPENIK